MNESEAAHRRRGGRDARRELRAAPIPAEKRAVKPGMEGGDYKPLSDAEVERIHRAALDILEQIGFSDAIPSCIELFTEVFLSDGLESKVHLRSSKRIQLPDSSSLSTRKNEKPVTSQEWPPSKKQKSNRRSG